MLGDTMTKMLRSAALAAAVIAASATMAAAQTGYRWDDGGYRYDRARLDVARDFGWQDGSLVARQDMAKYKPFQPYPRGKYAHEDHGYRREYGDKYAYEQEYAHAYQQAYEGTFRRY